MRAEWAREYVGVLTALSETNLVLLSGTGTSDGWQFEVRGESREEIAAFRTYCQEHDIAIDITAVHALLPIQSAGYELTDTQREALVLAYERGYFNSPRDVTMEELGEDLGISQQAGAQAQILQEF
jgi:predicted DNA binding protein